MSISEGSLPTCRWLQAGVLLVLASGLTGCLSRVHRLDKARWRPGTVPGGCKVYIQPEQAELSYDASGRLLSAVTPGLERVAGVRREVCLPDRDCRQLSDSRYTYDAAGELVEEFREERADTPGVRSASPLLHTHLRWEYPPAWEAPSFERTREETFDRTTWLNTQTRERLRLTYKEGRLVQLTGDLHRKYSYEGECGNVRLADERLYAPDLLGSLRAAPCITSPMGYHSTCVRSWW